MTAETRGVTLGAPILIEPRIQHYAWGDQRFIPELLGLESTGRPYAEAWFGAHPALPAVARLAGERIPVSELVSEHARTLLGDEVQDRFGGLPYLLKILAADKPLSVQVHPSKNWAIAGYRRENAAGLPSDAPERNYRDPNHKPELIVALGDFYALCGFRPCPEIAESLAGVPEIAALLPPFEETPESLATLVGAYYALPDELLMPALVRWLEQLSARPDLGPEAPEYWVVQAHHALCSNGCPDRGLLFCLMMNLLRLSAGEGFHLPAGVLHAHLRGCAIEVTASSDNVLRGGLTPKHVDVEELRRVVRYDCTRPSVVTATAAGPPGEQGYSTPAEEFELRLIHVGTELDPVERVASGPETLLALELEPGATLRVETPMGSVELAAGQSCLVPHGMHYLVRSRAAGKLVRVLVPGLDQALLFRGQDPPRLAFGTSGLRGLVRDITDIEAYVNTRGFLEYLVSVGDAAPGMSVAMAGDLRPSTDGPEHSIMRAVAQGVRDSDFSVENCGKIPTPALTYYALGRGCPSIMVTGSHIPFDRNGIKFNKSLGEVLKTDERGILEAVARVRRSEYMRARELSLFDDQGMFRSDVRWPLPRATSVAREAYVARYLGFFPKDALSGQRVVVYEHSAVGREILVQVLRSLGAEVHPLGRTEEFTAIDTEAISDACFRTVQALADQAARTVGPVDAVVSTDGDSDRPMLLGVDPDGRVRFFTGDVLGILTADYLRADAIAVPVSATDAIDLHFAPRGLEPKRTRIGSPWVIAAMAALAGKRRVGWESNGGFLTGSTIELEGRRLLALPTRDALLPILAALCTAKRRAQPLGRLFAELPQRFSSGGLLDEVPGELGHATIARYMPEDVELERVVFEGAAIRVTDASGVQTMASGALEQRLRQIRSGLSRHFSPDHGFGDIVRLDLLDGLRMGFSNGDIAHVRASGNAPQFRLYVVASTEHRVEDIVRSALGERGFLSGLLEETKALRFVEAIRTNVAFTNTLVGLGGSAALLVVVSGSESARRFGQRGIEAAKTTLRSEKALLFSDDLLVDRAFGLLRVWQHLGKHAPAGRGTLIAFVFGEGIRATPFTEAEQGQRAALLSFAVERHGRASRQLAAVELALYYLAPVESYLRRSGFDGVVAKWGNELQIPTLDLSGTNPVFASADVVSFVSRRSKSAQEGAGAGGADLGTTAVSRALLDALLEEFSAEVHDTSAERVNRPELDAQLFTAIGIATIDDTAERERAWRAGVAESEGLRRLERDLPLVLGRLRGVVEHFEARHGRKVRTASMDLGDAYRADVAEHREIYDFYLSLNHPGARGQVARAIAGLSERRDRDHNLIAGDTRISLGVSVSNSVLIDCRLYGEGEVVDSVLIGTRARDIHATGAFDVLSTAAELTLAPRAGSYRVVDAGHVMAGPGERVTTLLIGAGPVLMRVHEETDLTDPAVTYDVPILGNPASFADAHRVMLEMDPEDIAERREEAMRNVLDKISPE